MILSFVMAGISEENLGNSRKIWERNVDHNFAGGKYLATQ